MERKDDEFAAKLDLAMSAALRGDESGALVLLREGLSNTKPLSEMNNQFVSATEEIASLNPSGFVAANKMEVLGDNLVRALSLSDLEEARSAAVNLGFSVKQAFELGKSVSGAMLHPTTWGPLYDLILKFGDAVVQAEIQGQIGVASSFFAQFAMTVLPYYRNLPFEHWFMRIIQNTKAREGENDWLDLHADLWLRDPWSIGQAILHGHKGVGGSASSDLSVWANEMIAIGASVIGISRKRVTDEMRDEDSVLFHNFQEQLKISKNLAPKFKFLGKLAVAEAMYPYEWDHNRTKAHLESAKKPKPISSRVFDTVFESEKIPVPEDAGSLFEWDPKSDGWKGAYSALEKLSPDGLRALYYGAAAYGYCPFKIKDGFYRAYPKELLLEENPWKLSGR